MIKWTMINMNLLLMFLMIMNNLIFKNNNNNNYNNITTYNRNMELYSIQSPYMKNMNIIKRGYHTSLNNKLIIVQKKNNEDNLKMNNLEMENFYKWLVGFTDGDGSFYMKGTEKDLKFFYGFHLHKDDISCLEHMKKYLKMTNNINIRETSIQLTMTKKQWMNDNLLPIFDKYPCMTIKYYSYMKWKEGLMKSLNKVSSNKELMEYKTLINNYEIIKDMKIPYNHMNDHWILGFL
uniref:Orf1p n=1 Tax=Saccharomyces cariocanus TaxID=114526 RepID=A0A1D8GYK8_9SACH|nr:Orf1p [Saccharomyces cariocanus]AOT85162.1 Orf1p [Saccharomyces cariocanus]